MRTVDLTTSERLRIAKIHAGTLDGVIRAYGIRGITKGTLSRALRGESVSTQAERVIRKAFGMEEPPQKATTVCPSCFALGKTEVHAVGDCHGQPVAAVVVLAPGERVTAEPERQPQPVRKRTDEVNVKMKRAVKARHDARRRALGLSWPAYMERLLETE